MLFNSYSFILLFLPITLLLFFWLGNSSNRLAAAWLTAASLFFYGWWNPAYLGLLLGSIVVNYIAGTSISQDHARQREQRKKWTLILSISLNLLLLCYFKYVNFFLENLNGALDTGYRIGEIILPLGISFFTFTQIAFLVDAYQGKVKEYDFIHYCLFVTYFPHLIAGPVLHHKEMMPQFAESKTYRLNYDNIAIGLTIFSIGLFKKVILADGISPYATPVFDAAEQGHTLTLLQAWGGALAYTFQLYFDFSGYSDMAIGLSRLFGVSLPLNFNSPYKAINIIEFWRRWHMTLSRFLRDYLYIPLGGNRKGPAHRYINLMATMLLGGLWHGAGWTFVIWGGLHGCYLAVNHAWRTIRQTLGHDLSKSSFFGRCAAGSLTFIAVVVAWVFFRAQSLDAAFEILQGMVGANGMTLPAGITGYMGPFSWLIEQSALRFTTEADIQLLPTYSWVVALAAIAFLAPNTQQLMTEHAPALGYHEEPTGIENSPMTRKSTWQPSNRWALLMAVITLCGILSLGRVTEFLYFQF
ncbi:MAG: MBOAT family protein [Gammaproteobacteria bacterium]